MKEIIKLNDRPTIESNEKLNRRYVQFDELLGELKQVKLSPAVLGATNENVQVLNSIDDTDKKFGKQLAIAQSRILKLIEKEHKLVTKGHYRNTWLVLGMAVFGLPLGVAFGMSLGNMGLMALGLPIGIAVGIAVGMSMDNKAYEEGRQLNIEIKY